MSDWNDKIIAEFRANDGKVGGHFEGYTLLLLHTTGAKSGKERVNPLMCYADGDRYVVVASKAGAPSHPDWYHNIVAHPEVSVEVGTEHFDALATIADEPERTELYSKMESISSGFTEYKNKADRVIPVIILTRKD
ncbi:MAG: nitroreductase family deazaflavin-dependent oxidoreductase [Aggregatilineales bacterium]